MAQEKSDDDDSDAISGIVAQGKEEDLKTKPSSWDSGVVVQTPCVALRKVT